MNTPIELLLELAALKRYGKNGHPNRSEHLVTVNVPTQLFDRVDALLDSTEALTYEQINEVWKSANGTYLDRNEFGAMVVDFAHALLRASVSATASEK